MTISYTIDIATTTPLSFLKVILRWKGSVWKNCWKEYTIWVFAYFIIYNIIQHEHVSPELQKVFTNLIHHLDEKLIYIPLVLLLGFFVTFVIDRWKQVITNIAFIDNLAYTVSNYIVGSEEETVAARKNILRYACAAQVLLLRDISHKVKKRFPTMKSLVQSGILQEHEVNILEKGKCGTEKYTTPINWACGLVMKMKNAEKIGSDTLVAAIFKEINEFNKQLQNLCNYDYVPVPLAYPQVAFCVVRSYLAICLIARQYVVENPEQPKPTAGVETLAMSLMTLIQVFFYLAWIKVAEELLNPLGDDDDDFECNYVIDYNITRAVEMAETVNGIIPEQIKDNFKENPKNAKGYSGSVSNLK
ncbi:hypothetical protein FO519_002297 [Halicephalobus sp. NKZ332]|nr:hypothetical protein FO519_002297 [Halicephalobus sp. NKZ332]